jgi:hypothetical protein
MSLSRSTMMFRLIFVSFIVIASARTVIDASHFLASRSSLGLMTLGMVEIVAALLLLFRRTQVAGLVGLLTVFAIATLLSLIGGEVPYRFAYYAASATFLVIVDRAQLAHISGAALARPSLYR